MREVEDWDPFQGSMLLKEVSSYATLTISLKNNPLQGTLTSNNRYYVIDDGINPYEFWNVFLTALYNETGRISLMTHVFNDLRLKKTIHIISCANNCSRWHANFRKIDDANCVIEFSVPFALGLKRGRDYELINKNAYDKERIKTIDLIVQHSKKWHSHKPSTSVHSTLKNLTKAMLENFCSFFQCESKEERELAEKILFYIIAFSYPSADFPKKIITILNPNCYSSINREFSSGGVFIVWQPSCNLYKVLETDWYMEFSLRSKLHFLQETTRDLLIYSSFQATRSAIGSIMSRNGSHNIGSHVLAALSHNVGTMPDDRVLYQYIQQRMDYIANVTTETPSWTQPTMFWGDIMRTFLSQRHLLSHIAESEGLGAWEFQNKNMDDSEARGQHDKLRFQIRRRINRGKNGSINYVSVIGYEKDNGVTIDLQDDIALAIPGGIAGQHAFFTIIENIVRNAAKHDWSNPPKRTEVFKKKRNGHRYDGKHGNLNIYIDYEDKDVDGCVEFTIWTNMSDVLEHVDDGKGCESPKAIHNVLNKKLDAQFIDETTGRLRRENWGLAEMRISAGYLQGNNISEIGGIDKPAKPIIQATVHNEDGINHLAYRFCVPKPKRMLILVDDDRSNRTECEKARLQEVLKKYRNQASECKKFGLYVKTYTEVKAECSDKKKPKLNYEYVVMDDMREEQASWYLPFRVLSIKQTEVAGAKDLVPTIGGYASCLDIIEDVTESKGRKSSIESNIKLVEEAIYSSWCSYIKSLQIEKNTALNLILSVKNDSSGNEGRGLISKRDVVKFVFEESFNSAVRSYIKLNKLSEVSEAYVALNALKEKRRGLVELDIMEGNDYKGLIMRCFQSFCTPTNSVAREESRITKEIAKVKSDKKIKENFRTKRLAELRKELDEARNKTQEEVGRGIGAYGGFLDYLEKVCEQMETILCKYAENIVTLPSGFRSDGVGVVEEFGKVWDAAAVGWWKGPRPSDDALGSVGLDIKAPTIEFIRHYHPEDKDDQPGNRLYAEPLSGSQSYLNMLEKCSFSDKAMIVKLVETALLRVLIIDERVAKFLREHKDEVSYTYKSMRIYVADDKKVDEDLQVLQGNSDKAGIGKLKEVRWNTPSLDSLLVPLSSYNIYEGRKVLQNEDGRVVDRNLQTKFAKDGKKLFDVLIVHQGIIDKWFPATANSPETVEKLLHYLRQIFPYVIITTGRGSPANIPETARMLPFSTVEATLFRKYPEKLLLIDSVMNILPKGESSYE